MSATEILEKHRRLRVHIKKVLIVGLIVAV